MEIVKPRIYEHTEWFANEMRVCVNGTANLRCAIRASVDTQLSDCTTFGTTIVHKYLGYFMEIVKPRIYEHAEWFAKHSRLVREWNARMCGRDCKPVLSHPRMVRILFATNRNLSVFCMNIKKTVCVSCLFYAPGVLCSPQVRGKVINRAPLTLRMRTVQCVSSTLVYIQSLRTFWR